MNVDQEFQIALDYLDAKKTNKAEEIFLKLDKEAPQIIGIKMNLAGINYNRGDTLTAIKYLKEALKIDPEHYPAVSFLAEITRSKKNIQQTEKLKNTIIALSSEQYYSDYEQKSPLINSKYRKFIIKITGKVITKDASQGIIYLKGRREVKEESVICRNTHKIFNQVKAGDIVTFLGYCLGLGQDSQEPILLYKSDQN